MNTHNNISVCAPAKINLFLHVVGKREDGYHLLDSLVVFTECGDLIDVEAFDAISIEVVGRFAASLSNIPQEENLVWKAAMALQKYTHSNQGAHIRLTKNLPIGSGIGGGSADAAATIHALLKLWKLDIPQKNLSEIALTLGSDVPVCLYGKPALMRGIGDDLIPVTLQEKIYLVLINPNILLSTAEVFRDFNYNKNLSPKRKLLENVCSFTEISDEIEFSNDLELVSIQKLPIIGEMLLALRGTQGCFLARMSGSGATCFGLYYDEESACRAAKKLQVIYPQAWCELTHIIANNC